MNVKRKPDLSDMDKIRNPFTEAIDFCIKVRERVDFNSYENKVGEKVPKEYLLEKDISTKVFISEERRLDMCGRKGHTQRLFLWILYMMDLNKDYVWIEKKKYMRENKIKDNRTYKSSIKELCDMGYLSISTKKDVYWINPTLFFCGSRINKYKDKLVVYEPKKRIADESE